MANSDGHVKGSANLSPDGSGLGRLLSYVWAFLPVLSLGHLAPIPIIHAAIKLRTWTLWAASAVYSAATIVLWSATTTVTVGDEPPDTAAVPEPAAWTFFLLLALMMVPTAHALAIRGRVFQPKRQQPALLAAVQARQRREEAKAIVARDIDLARELRIGRPDLPRQFDDGGLVDLNHAPASVIVQLLGFSEADAAQIMETRERIGGFISPEEVIAQTNLSLLQVDRISERLVFLP